MDIVSGIQEASAVVKRAIQNANGLKNTELVSSLADLQKKLAEINIQATELLEENRRLKESAAKAPPPSEVVLKDGAYFKLNGDGPLCTSCYDSRKELSLLTELAATHRIMGKWKCPSCKAYSGAQ